MHIGVTETNMPLLRRHTDDDKSFERRRRQKRIEPILSGSSQQMLMGEIILHTEKKNRVKIKIHAIVITNLKKN